MTDKSAYGGLFQDPPYLSTDSDPKKTDPYDKKDAIPSRYLGKNMMTSHTAPGVHPDAFFEHQYLTLASSEQNGGKSVAYEDESKRVHREAMESRKHNVSDKTFKYTSRTAESTGPGSYFGCFQSTPYEYMTEPWDDGSKKRKKQKAKKSVEEQPKTTLPNIKTSPGKKGTYGVPGTLLTNPTYNENWREETAEADKAEAKRKQREEAVAPKPLGAAFKTSTVSRAYIEQMPNTGVSAVYAEAAPLPEGKASAKKRREAEKASAPTLEQKPFKGSAARSGQQGCINPFPNVWVDPEAVDAGKKSKKRGGKNAPAAPAEGERLRGAPDWKPNSFGKSSVVSSCLRTFH